MRPPTDRGSERGVTLVLFALVLPLFMVLAAVVWDVGNWWVHAKHLQTKVDAAAFAGGGSWGFPCGPDIDANIETQARRYVGEHMQANGVPFDATTFNPQVGGTPGSRIHVVLNGSTWWDDDEGSAPLDGTSPLSTSLCESKTLDVKATEENNIPLFGWLPFFPDIKRKARVQIEEVEGLTGLLPIAVRLPQPLSAAAVSYDEASPTKAILDVRYFREVCTPFSPGGCIFGIPPGLGQWTTQPALGDTSGLARFNVGSTTGVVVATSFRPRCGAGTPPAGPPCLEDSGWAAQSVDSFCREPAVQCYDADGSGTTQTIRSGVHFIRGYGNADTGTGAPQLRSAYLDSPSLNCSAYFNSSPNSCAVRLNVAVNLGALEGVYPNPPGPDTQQPLRASDVQVRYRLVRANGTLFCDFGANCDLQGSGTGTPTFSTQGNAVSPHLPITASSRGNAVAIEIMLRNAVNHSNPNCTGPGFNPNCRWFYTGNGVFGSSVAPTDLEILAAPIQRSFMGDIDRTTPLEWLRLSTDRGCDGNPDGSGNGLPNFTDGEAASLPFGEHCFLVEMGLSGGLARDQDEPPVALNVGTGSSQRATIDCDRDIPNLKSEIVSGCQWPSYAANKFDPPPLCPGTAGFFDTPKAAPFDKWPPFRCVLTQTSANPQQIIQGFNERIFGSSNNPTCPPEDLTGYPPPTGSAARWTKGRNYWHRDNNVIDEYTYAWDGDTPGTTLAEKADDWGNKLRDNDPRLVTLFFTSYDSFTGPGNDVYPIVGFGNFYITGYGTTANGSWQGGAPDDPCNDGNDGDLSNGNGNEPPPDLDFSRNTTWVWGHFVKDVVPNPFSTGGSGVLCNPGASFQPCVAVLVE